MDDDKFDMKSIVDKFGLQVNLSRKLRRRIEVVIVVTLALCMVVPVIWGMISDNTVQRAVKLIDAMSGYDGPYAVLALLLGGSKYLGHRENVKTVDRAGQS